MKVKPSVLSCLHLTCVSLSFFPQLYWAISNITLCKLRLYNIMIWYMNIFWNVHHNKVSQHIHHLMSFCARARACVYVCVCSIYTEKEMATHSSVLAWRIPWMGEPGGLLFMGSHSVGHDWRDLAAAAAMCIGSS